MKCSIPLNCCSVDGCLTRNNILNTIFHVRLQRTQSVFLCSTDARMCDRKYCQKNDVHTHNPSEWGERENERELMGLWRKGVLEGEGV